MSIKVGDIVKPKDANGPLMIVEQVNWGLPGVITASWFDSDLGRTVNGVYTEDVLSPANLADIDIGH